MMTKIAPSILSADFTKLGSEIDSISDADLIHFDVMDGVFVPNLSIGIPVLKSVKKYSAIPIDVHLMITKPNNLIESFCLAGADYISFHLESTDCSGIFESINIVKKHNIKVGLAVKPNTDINDVLPYIDYLDFILVMTVEPGFGGQKFIFAMHSKIEALKKIILHKNLNCLIEVDGGINYETANIVKSSGADILVSGSYIFNSSDRNERINMLR